MKKIDADLLIIGSGIAGISAALEAQKYCSRIALIDKGSLLSSGSTFVNFNSRWGLTYALDDREKDSLLRRINEISKGTNNTRLSATVVENSHLAFQFLKACQVRFRFSGDGRIKRYSPCFMDEPLAAVVESVTGVANELGKRLDKTRIIRFEKHKVIELLVETDRCAGCLVVSDYDEEILFSSRATILATGGNGALFTPNIVDEGLLGDGYKMLESLGVRMKNLQYMQRVWETAHFEKQRFPVSLLGSSEVIYEDYQGREIEMVNAVNRFGDSRVTHVPIANLQDDKLLDELLIACIPRLGKQYGIRVKDQANRLLYIILPYYQASNGGVEIGVNGETPVQGLYAAGEVTTGMHGGDRVGGMMITSAIVFGRRAATHACNSYMK